MRGLGWSCVALYCLVQLGIVSPEWLKGQWNHLTYRQTTAPPRGEIDRDIGNDSKPRKEQDGNFYD